MGIENYQGNVLWLTISGGKLVNKKKEISANAYTGFLKKIELRTDDYEGQEVEKVLLTLKDKDETAKVQFTFESWYSIGFFERITNVDITKAVTIGAMPSDQNEKMSFCWMKQGETKIVKTDMVKPENTLIGKRQIKDWTKFIEAAHKIISDINSKIDFVSSETKDEQEQLPF